MPRGGRRIGAGRKPTRRVLDMPAQVLQHPSVPPLSGPVPVEEFDAPATLLTEERLVWLRQAPFAFQARTLNTATALAFERYCRVVCMEQREAGSSAANGSNHRGLLKLINDYELQFLLAPAGKPIYAAQSEKPANPLERYLHRNRA